MSTGNSYRKKPVVVRAVKFDGTPESMSEIKGFGVDIWVRFKPNPNFKLEWSLCSDEELISKGSQIDYIEIPTLEGIMRANIGDWIIKGVNGEFYPCKPDIFEKTYEEV